MKLPTLIATIRDLQATGKYLDSLADRAISDDVHAVARAHAIRVWNAVDRVEALAELVEDLAAATFPHDQFPPAVVREQLPCT